MKLYGARVFVTDLQQARRFYSKTLGLPMLFDHRDAVGFDIGIHLIVELDDGEHDNLSGRFTGLSIASDDITADYERLQAHGVSFAAPPSRQSWGGVLAHFSDPSGNVWTLVSDEPGDADRSLRDAAGSRRP